MKVILKEYVYKHGVAGDVVNVANGFARNYLIPRGLAVQASEQALQQNEDLLNQAVVRRQELNARLIEVSNQIAGVELIFGRKAGSNGKLYGSVTPQDIAEALLEETGIDINRRRISERGLRELGSHPVTIRMGAELAPNIRVTIVREEDLAAYLAGDMGEEEADIVDEDFDDDAEFEAEDIVEADDAELETEEADEAADEE